MRLTPNFTRVMEVIGSLKIDQFKDQGEYRLAVMEILESLEDQLQIKAPEQIWNNLTQHKIDDRDIQAQTHTRKKKVVNEQSGATEWVEEEYQLHYYSWGACWRELMNRYPSATYEFSTFEREGKLYDVMYYADSTASVHCTVGIDGVFRDMWLPVMDYRNKAIPNPDARAISDAKMRCLVKTVAMFGLGLDIYEGAYVPPEDRPEPEPKDETPEEPEPSLPRFERFSSEGMEMAVFNDATSWLRHMETQGPLGRNNQHNRAVAEKVIDYVMAQPRVRDKTKTDTIRRIRNLFSQE